MSITEKLSAVGSGSVRLRPDTPASIANMLRGPIGGAFGGSWVLATSEYPGPGLKLSRETLGAMSGGSPVGGMVSKLSPSADGVTVELEGWASILTSQATGLDVGLVSGWWDSQGPRNTGWWLARVCAVDLDSSDPDASHDPAKGFWVEQGAAMGGGNLAVTGAGWRTRLDGLELVASVCGFEWAVRLVGGKPTISTVAPSTGRFFLLSDVVTPGRYRNCPSPALYGGTKFDVTCLGAANFDQDGRQVAANIGLAVVGDGKTVTDVAITTTGVTPADDWAGRPLPRVALTSVSEGDDPGTTASNLSAAAEDAAADPASGTRITLDSGLGVEDMPQLNDYAMIHHPPTGTDFAMAGADAAEAPALAVGAHVIGAFPLTNTRCIERTTPITADMGVWFVNMAPGAGQAVTDLTPYIVPESGQPSVTFGTVEKRTIRQEILGNARGVTIIAN